MTKDGGDWESAKDKKKQERREKERRREEVKRLKGEGEVGEGKGGSEENCGGSGRFHGQCIHQYSSKG